MTLKPRLRFYPFAYALFTEELCDRCWYCLAPVETKKRCLGCGFALFCNKDCQSLGWKDHKAECKGLRKAQVIPDIETRMLGRIVLRHKEICAGKDKKTEGFYKDRTSERSILEIWAHTDKIRKDSYAMKKFEEIYESLTKFYEEKFMMSKDVVFELHCRDYINRHAISDKGYVKEIGKGLYLDLCAYDHSCRPNTIFTCDGFIATLRGLSSDVDIKNRSTTFYTYIDLLCSLQQRKKQLKDTWYFDCQCERCTDPSDHLLTSVLCPLCPSDNRAEICIFGEHSYKNVKSSVLTCEKCGNEVPKDYVVEAVNAMRFIDQIFEDRELEQMPSKTRVEFLEDLLERFTKILSGCNIYLCKLVQNLIPLIDPNNNQDLLRLHLRSENCVRRCFPKNHPAIAFHLRNIGIFLNNLNRYEEALKYFREAQDIMEFTLDADHPMTVENRSLLEQTMKNLGCTVEPENPTKAEDPQTNANLPNGDEKRSKEVEEIPKDLKNEKKSDVVKKPSQPSRGKPVGITIGLKKKCNDLFSDDLSDLPELIQ
uniref:MYND-type domain-containing protein n=1 Tax=Haemonchus contortus TaxID=6289 RepID=A0A7I4Z554_HAECO